MISASTLTYGRYNAAPTFSYKPHSAEKEDEVQELPAKSTTRPRRRSLFGDRQEVATPVSNVERLNDLVERLNARIHPDGTSVRFRLQDGRSPGIIMERDDIGIVSQYIGEGVSYLEDHLHDMAGLHFSVLS